MQHKRLYFQIVIMSFGLLVFTGCGPMPNTANVNTVNSNTNISNSVANNTNAGMANTNSAASTVEATEPNQYQAKIQLTLEAIGETQKTSLPALGANVARSGADRMMEFALPNNEKVIFLDKGGVNYLILPNRRQYAELTKETLGFEIRRLLMPEQIVDQIKALQGVQLIGEETVNGRQVVKYGYAATADTQTKAGQVATESFLLVDKETGLPLRSETVSQSQTGGNVQGYKGLRIVTEMSDIKTTPNEGIFNLPSDYQKIDSEQVRAQVNLVFNTVAALIGQAMKQAQPNPSPAAN